MRPQELELSINIELRDPSQSYAALRLSETVTLTVAGFLEAAKVLGQFHDLAEALKQKQKPKL